MTTTENAKQLLSDLVDRLDTQTIAQFCTKRLFSRGVELPMHNWSTLNQIACFLAGTADARGIDQWRKVGRWPRKGCHAIYILVPMFRTVTEKKSEQPETQEGSAEQADHRGVRQAAGQFRLHRRAHHPVERRPPERDSRGAR